jgi:hypothetical protein
MRIADIQDIYPFVFSSAKFIEKWLCPFSVAELQTVKLCMKERVGRIPVFRPGGQGFLRS